LPSPFLNPDKSVLRSEWSRWKTAIEVSDSSLKGYFAWTQGRRQSASTPCSNWARARMRSREKMLRDELRNYYESELTFLRQMGAEFAERHPKIASRLVLEPDRCEDPHVERILEAFALLAA